MLTAPSVPVPPRKAPSSTATVPPSVPLTRSVPPETSVAPEKPPLAPLSGAVNAPWGNGQFAIFQGNAGTVTVETDAGISVTGMQFAVDGYTVTGSAIALQNQETVIRVGTGARSGETMTATIDSVLYGTSALVKHDYGTLILSQANLYSGGTFVRGGVLQVADDRSLGADTGGLVIDNATLRTTADMASARAVELAGTHGTIETDGGTSLTLSGPVFGAGSLVKEGAGRLELNGTSSYAGNTFVRAGTLVGDAGSIRGALVNDGETVFDQAVTGTFAGTVQGGGLAIKEGAGQLILSGDSIARWQVDAGTLTSAAERFTGDVAIGDAGTLNFEQIADAGYGGNLTGSGALLKTGGGLLELSADSGDFAGATTIAGGTLRLTNKLGGTMDVLANARLEGDGEVGSTVVRSGGVIAPGVGGATIATLEVNGNIVLETGSAFEVNITPALEGDLIAATGSADIQGGTVTVNGVAGVYAHGSRWTILSAAGGRTGTFDSLVEDLPFVDLSLAYDGNNAFLDAARNDTAFCLSGFTFNQCAAANSVDSLGAANALAGLAAALPDAESAAQAFDLLSGEIHASAAGVLTGSSHFVRDAAVNRVRAAFDEVAAAPLPMLAYAGEGAAQALPDPERLAFWAQGLGSSGHFDGDGNAARADRSIGGVFVGGDGFVNDSIRIGLLTGYSHSSFDVDDRLSSGSADSYHIGLYGGGQWGAFGARFGGVYSSHTVEVSRIAAFPGFSEQLSADDDGSTGQLFGELGYRVTVGGARLEPFANLAYVSTSLDDFSETGGLAALNGNSDLDTTFMTLGLRGETDVIVGETETRLFGGIGWRHAFGDVTPIAALNFAGGDPFAISGAPIAENSLALTGGFEVNLTPTARLGLTYDGQIGSNAVDHGLTADFRLKF